MRYKKDWEKTQQKFIEYWNKENHDRPILNLTAPKDGYKKSAEIVTPEILKERWMDTEYVIKKARESMESTYFAAEAFPLLWPNLGPDIFGATYGGDIVFEETTSYATQLIKEWEEDKKLVFNTKNNWWEKMVQMTEYITADAKGDYMVGITDLHPGMDGLVTLRGPENLCMDIYDCPELVKERNFEMFEGFKQQLDTLYSITTKNLSGSTNWMGIWHPEKWYVTSCDFSCMISESMFEEFVLPELKAEIDYLGGNTIYHLDGPGALKHLDALLEIPNLAGIQWVYGAGQPTAAHWVNVLKKIQNAGKLIQIGTTIKDLDVLVEEIKPEGVMYWLCEDFASEEDANNLVKKVEGAYKKKFY